LKQENWNVNKAEIWKRTKKGTLLRARSGTKIEMGKQLKEEGGDKKDGLAN
jgi:hypothetical protein